MPQFVPQFPIKRVPELAARYADEDDTEVLSIASAARRRGHYTRAGFIKVCAWKSPRPRRLAAANDEKTVRDATHRALDESTPERERIKALRALRGVDWATASALLHLTHPERYPIVDPRALEALGVRPRGYGFRFWEAYVSAYVKLIERAGVDGRTLDRALWQWSRDQGPSGGRARVSV